MRSSGGVATVVEAAAHRKWVLFSGQAAGVVGAEGLAAAVGEPNAISLDMGWTSTDVCLIAGDDGERSVERAVAGLPIRLRCASARDGAGVPRAALRDAPANVKPFGHDPPLSRNVGEDRGVSQCRRETVRETVDRATSPRPGVLARNPRSIVCEKRLWKPNCGDGAAQDSNLPSRGLHDLTGFDRVARPRERPRSRPGRSRRRA
jgi:hypothetical protein